MKNGKILLGTGLSVFVLALLGLGLMNLDVAMAQSNYSYQDFLLTGIGNNTETVYNINFSGVSLMEITGGSENVFHMARIPVVVNVANDNVISAETRSNILGGNNIRIGNSNNITVIGGEGNVGDNNSNATFFGGLGNRIDANIDSDSVSSVLLGGQNNLLETGHESNVIVGGSENRIMQDAQNVNILGGNRIVISGSNVVAGGQLITGDMQDSFVFNDGLEGLDLTTNGTFFLKVQNGVGFGMGGQSNNPGAFSYGSVNIGNVNISSVRCVGDDSNEISSKIGLIGTWNGCLVGCTSGSASLGRWELLDHGNACASMCSENPTNCVQGETTESTLDYTSFCTEGLENTINSTRCPNTSLDAFHNVIFETYLIDSDDVCPQNALNQCVYQCNEHSHLTGDNSGYFTGKARCFQDCPLPWSGTQYKKHNEIITGYSVSNTECYHGLGSDDVCAPYRSNLMCVNGVWHVMMGGEVTQIVNTGYNYERCMFKEYRCDTGSDAFNLTREDIINQKQDYVIMIWGYNSVGGTSYQYLTNFLNGNIVPGQLFNYSDIVWSNDVALQSESNIQEGIRGKYELCIDYDPVSSNEEVSSDGEYCVEHNPFPTQYHYKFIECNTGSGYYMAEDGVCRKECTYSGEKIMHLSGITLFTGESTVCPDICHGAVFTCYDGTLYADLNMGSSGQFISGTSLDLEVYSWTGCNFTGAVCDSSFNLTQAEYESMLEDGIYTGLFTSCQRSYAHNNGNECVLQETVYRLETGYEDLDVYFLTDEGNISPLTILDRNLGATAYVGEEGKDYSDSYGNYYQWGNNYGFPNQGAVNTSSDKVYISGYGPENPYMSNVFYDGDESRFTGMNHNLWGHLSNTKSDRKGPCPDGYHVPESSELVDMVHSWAEYGYHIDQHSYCVSGGNNTEGFLYGPHLESDFLMPCAGMRHNTFVSGKDAWAYYLSSSYNWTRDDLGNYNTISTSILEFSNSLDMCVGVVGDSSGGFRDSLSFGGSVRCFKDSPNQSLTIDADGGTGTMIIVHGDKIMKLGTPTKGNMIFGGWYWDEEYTSRAETGQTVPASTNLYAKWE